MTVAADLGDVELAGAFLLGIVVTIRLARLAIFIIRREQDRA